MKKLCTFLTAILIGATALFATACDPITFSYEDADKYVMGTAQLDENINSLEIFWQRGEVRVEYADVETITFEESADVELVEAEQMYHLVDGDLLHIQYAKAGPYFGTLRKKTLKVLIPRGNTLDKLEIEVISANIFITDINVNDVEIDNCDGTTQASFGSVIEAEIMQRAEEGTVSFVNAPKRGDFSTSTSATLTVKFPADVGFTAEMTRGDERAKINCDFETVRYGYGYVCGDGVNQYDFDAGYRGTINVQKLS